MILKDSEVQFYIVLHCLQLTLLLVSYWLKKYVSGLIPKRKFFLLQIHLYQQYPPSHSLIIRISLTQGLPSTSAVSISRNVIGRLNFPSQDNRIKLGSLAASHNLMLIDHLRVIDNHTTILQQQFHQALSTILALQLSNFRSFSSYIHKQCLLLLPQVSCLIVLQVCHILNRSWILVLHIICLQILQNLCFDLGRPYRLIHCDELLIALTWLPHTLCLPNVFVRTFLLIVAYFTAVMTSSPQVLTVSPSMTLFSAYKTLSW